MSRPAGSKNKPKSPVVINNDDFAQAFTGAGTKADRSTAVRQKSTALFGEGALDDMYTGNGFSRIIVDIPAEEMTRAGVYIDDATDDIKNFIESRLQDLDAMRHMNDSVRWSRLFGGSLLIYGLNDGGTLDTPLNPDGVQSVEFLRVYDRYQAVILSRYQDANNINYGKPEFWSISPRTGGQPYVVHESRCHAFDGESLSDMRRQSNQGWGASSLQACYDELVRLGMSHQWANMLLERAQQAVHGIPNLTTLLRAPGGDRLIQQRVDVVDMVRSVLNTIVIDSAESFDLKSTSFAGVPDIMDRFAEALSAVSRIPVYVLMGRSPGGLSNSDSAGKEAWNARIESMQKDILRKPIDRLVSYLMIEQSGSAESEYSLCFHPLIVKSDKEAAETDKIKADIKKSEAETAQIYVNLGALDNNEVRSSIEDDYDVTGTIDITPEERTAAIAAEAVAQSQAMGGNNANL